MTTALEQRKQYLMELKTAFAVEFECKWRVQSFVADDTWAMCCAYADARIVQQLLDDNCVFGWERAHKSESGNTFCGIGIHMPDGGVLWRWDVGAPSKSDPVKGASSDSFKRAAVNWGIGRFLYAVDFEWLPAAKNGKYTNVVDGNGKTIRDVNEHVHSLYNKKRLWNAIGQNEKMLDEIAKNYGKPAADFHSFDIRKILKQIGEKS